MEFLQIVSLYFGLVSPSEFCVDSDKFRPNDQLMHETRSSRAPEVKELHILTGRNIEWVDCELEEGIPWVIAKVVEKDDPVDALDRTYRARCCRTCDRAPKANLPTEQAIDSFRSNNPEPGRDHSGEQGRTELIFRRNQFR
jgi:hypothetical protein